MKSLARKLLEKFSNINEAGEYNISAPKDASRKVQNFIVYLYKEGGKLPYETFERFGEKRLATVIKKMKWLLNQWPFSSNVEKGVYAKIKIFTTFKDHFEHDSEDPVLDLSIEDFMKL